MDPRSKLLSAIALATMTASVAKPADAQALPSLAQEELYQQCFETDLSEVDRANACSCFIEMFPDSRLTPAVLSAAVELGRDDDYLSDGSQLGCGGSIDARFLASEDEAEIY